mmetsp:Transcript_1646/g.4410  ORF Transcript_1646/g.4410 Transcript_1646/m.4410 type:complete len:227 (+) Transcript_1646:425-1105(+)
MTTPKGSVSHAHRAARPKREEGTKKKPAAHRELDSIRAIYLLRDRLDLLRQRALQIIRIPKLRPTFLARLYHRLRQRHRALPALLPMIRDHRAARAPLPRGVHHELQLPVRVGAEAVEGDDDGNPERGRVFDVLQEVGEPRGEEFEVFARVFRGEGGPRGDRRAAAVHFEGADGRDEDGAGRGEVAGAAFDVAEFFEANVRAETRFGDDKAVLAHELERDLVCHHG